MHFFPWKYYVLDSLAQFHRFGNTQAATIIETLRARLWSFANEFPWALISTDRVYSRQLSEYLPGTLNTRTMYVYYNGWSTKIIFGSRAKRN